MFFLRVYHTFIKIVSISSLALGSKVHKGLPFAIIQTTKMNLYVWEREREDPVTKKTMAYRHRSSILWLIPPRGVHVDNKCWDLGILVSSHQPNIWPMGLKVVGKLFDWERCWSRSRGMEYFENPSQKRIKYIIGYVENMNFNVKQRWTTAVQ